DSMALGYGDEIRPPGTIPNASIQPRWPIAEPRYVLPPAPTYEAPYDPRFVPPQELPPPGAPRFDPGPRYDQPVSLDPPLPGDVPGAGVEPLDFRRPYGAPKPPPARPPALRAPLDAA